MSRVLYEGRYVTAQWYNKYVRGVVRKPAASILLFIPAIPELGEDGAAEVRRVNLNDKMQARQMRQVIDAYAEYYAPPPRNQRCCPKNKHKPHLTI